MMGVHVPGMWECHSCKERIETLPDDPRYIGPAICHCGNRMFLVSYMTLYKELKRSLEPTPQVFTTTE
jgi:hypothetical protein